jgi:uncharacterized protein (DUF1501 family)
MNRRQFLLAATGLLLPIGSTGMAARAADGDPRRLIVIFLRGAVDGLSVVVPHGEEEYYDARRSIALAQPKRDNGVLDLDGHFGLHPSLAPLLPLWRENSLGFVHACGSPDPTRSHFDAQLFMENGTAGHGAGTDGWMNRLLGQLPGPATASRALAFGPQVPRILTGAQPVANVGSGARADRKLPIDRPEVAEAFAHLYGGDDRLSQNLQDARQTRMRIQGDMGEESVMTGSEGAPNADGFAADAQRLAKLMRRDPEIRLAFFALGGWDTHIRQGNAEGALARNLKGLGDGLAQLASGLGPVYGDSLILVMSEFGRTVHENGNGGTDHGHGNVLWALGGPVAGGKVGGVWPGLSEDRLYERRDLAITSDYRSVLGPAVATHFGLAPQSAGSLFPGGPAVGGPILLRA